MPIDELKVGQRFVVRPGEKVATDGTVEVGRSAIDMSMLTDRSQSRCSRARTSPERRSTPVGG